MCFSASASFGAGVVLSVIGTASLRQQQTRSDILFASIPLIFGVQQITEGFLWLALSNPAYSSLQQLTTYIFLFFAQVVWPLWVPLAILLFETKAKKRALQKILVVMGLLVSCYLAYCLFTFPVEAKITGYHIAYDQHYPAALSKYVGLFYIIATIVPPFLSSIRNMWLLGTAILVSYIITTLFYEDYVVSVWCFFASIISISVFVIMREIKKLNKKLFTFCDVVYKKEH